MENKSSITALMSAFGRAFHAERRVKNTIMMAAAGGEPIGTSFSYTELEKLLEKHGFLIYELLTPEDIQRDIIDKAGADMKAFEHVNYCLAVRKG